MMDRVDGAWNCVAAHGIGMGFLNIGTLHNPGGTRPRSAVLSGHAPDSGNKEDTDNCGLSQTWPITEVHGSR